MNPTDNAPRHGMTRRGLFTATAATAVMGAVATVATAPLGRTLKAAAPKRVAGIQLYTVRESMAEDPLATLTALAAMGFKAVEFAGYQGVAPAQLRAWLDELGLAAPAAHVGPHELRDNPESLVEQAAVLGHEYLVMPWLGEDDRRTADQYRGWADVLNRAGELARAAGLKTGYHNHGFEFETVDGVLPLRLLLEETDPALVDFELDFFWARQAGFDITEVLSWAPERFTMAHIKDMSAEGEMVDVGTGVIDFAGLLASPEAEHIRHPFVEHDNPARPFRTAAIGRLNLDRALG